MDPTQRQAAERQLTIVVIALVLAFMMHALGLLSAFMNIAIDLGSEHGIAQLGSSGLSDEQQGEILGRAIGFVGCALYSGVGLVAIPVLAWGVHGRKAWARTGALVYFASTLITCCCMPIGAFGIYALLRADVRALFDERLA